MHWLWRDADIVIIEDLAVVGKVFPAPGQFHDFQALFKTLTAAFHRNGKRVVIVWMITGRQPTDQTAFRHQINHGHLLGNMDWVIQREDENIRAQTNPGRASG